MSVFLERLQLKNRIREEEESWDGTLLFCRKSLLWLFSFIFCQVLSPTYVLSDKSCVRCREQEWKDQNQIKNYTDVKSAKDSSRSLHFLILLGCERTANQFKEGARGCKACSASLAARLCLQGCSPWSGAGDGEEVVAVLLGGGGRSCIWHRSRWEDGCRKVKFWAREGAEVAGLGCLSEADWRNEQAPKPWR